MGEQKLRLFVETGKSVNIPLKSIIKRGEIATAVITVDSENSVDLIIQSARHGKIVAEWMNRS